MTDSPFLIPEPVRVGPFKGLNNRADPAALGWEWLLQADNALCDMAGHLVRRPGFAALGGGYKDIYGARDGRLFLIDADDRLLQMGDDGRIAPIAMGAIGAPFAWETLGTALFLMSPTARWAVYPDRVIPWGSLCPTLSGLEEDAVFPPPVGEVLASRRNQMLVGAWDEARGASAIYASRPDYPHEFRLHKDFQLVPGRITLLAAVSRGLVIGTDRAIYVDEIDAPLRRVADYGVPLGAAAFDDRDTVWFWTWRGLCRALPFENMTDAVWAATARERVTAAVLPWRGSTYAVAQQRGALRAPVTRAFVPQAIAKTHSQFIPP